MGCISEKNSQKKAQFKYEIYERAPPFEVKEDIRYDVQKNPIVQRRVKSTSQTPDQKTRTKQYSDLNPSCKPQF